MRPRRCRGLQPGVGSAPSPTSAREPLPEQPLARHELDDRSADRRRGRRRCGRFRGDADEVGRGLPRRSVRRARPPEQRHRPEVVAGPVRRPSWSTVHLRLDRPAGAAAVRAVRHACRRAVSLPRRPARGDHAAGRPTSNWSRGSEPRSSSSMRPSPGATAVPTSTTPLRSGRRGTSPAGRARASVPWRSSRRRGGTPGTRGCRIGPVMADDPDDIAPIFAAALRPPHGPCRSAPMSCRRSFRRACRPLPVLLGAGFEVVDTDLLMASDDAVDRPLTATCPRSTLRDRIPGCSPSTDLSTDLQVAERRRRVDAGLLR